MKGVLAALLVLAAQPAVAGEQDFREALDQGSWSGCVYQEGYEPYPILLMPSAGKFVVQYPALCTGSHELTLSATGFDATEVIFIDPQRCVQDLPVTYLTEPGRLRLNFHDAHPGTYAVLQPASSGFVQPVCSPDGAVS